MRETLTYSSPTEEAEVWFEVEQHETEPTEFPKLDGVLMPLVAGNADVVAPCPWMDGAEVPLTVAMNNYYQTMTEENADTVIDDVCEFLAGRVTSEEDEESVVALEELAVPAEEAPRNDEANEEPAEPRAPLSRTNKTIAVTAIQEAQAEQTAPTTPVITPSEPAFEADRTTPGDELRSEREMDSVIAEETGDTEQGVTPPETAPSVRGVYAIESTDEDAWVKSGQPVTVPEISEEVVRAREAVDRVFSDITNSPPPREDGHAQPAAVESRTAMLANHSESEILSEVEISSEENEGLPVELSVSATEYYAETSDEGHEADSDTAEITPPEALANDSVQAEALASESETVLFAEMIGDDRDDVCIIGGEIQNAPDTFIPEVDKVADGAEWKPEDETIRVVEMIDELPADFSPQVEIDDPVLPDPTIELAGPIVVEAAPAVVSMGDMSPDDEPLIEWQSFKYYDELSDDPAVEDQEDVVDGRMVPIAETQPIEPFELPDDDESVPQHIARSRTAGSAAHATSSVTNTLDQLIVIGKSALRLHVAIHH